MDNSRDIIGKYIPAEATEAVLSFLSEHRVHLKISKVRHTRLGDYRPPGKYPTHRISINHNLNPYQFLITLLHEFAHLLTWQQSGSKVRPHEKEWKRNFSALVAEYLKAGIFPPDIVPVLEKTALNPEFTSAADSCLREALAAYDEKKRLTLEDVPADTLFRIYNGFVFRKIEKVRTRYKCQRVDNRRLYLVSSAMPVIPVNENSPGSREHSE